ncbi:MAG TPA: hypothetical protein VG474_10380, partial [Solirubrobacteraceae bacterium]|nr:hypothetical protein [Solirubrobacteraceae bacterium]
MLVQRQRGERHVARNRDRRAQHVEQLDRCDRRRQELAVELAMVADDVGRAVLRGGDLPAPDAVDDSPQPALGARPQRLAAQLAQSHAAGSLEHRGELAGAPRDVALGQRHRAPAAHRAAQDLLGLLVDHDGVAAPPAIDRGAPLGGGQREQRREALGAQQRQEHLLAVAVRRAVEQCRAALVLQQRQRGRRQRPAARE